MKQAATGAPPADAVDKEPAAATDTAQTGATEVDPALVLRLKAAIRANYGDKMSPKAGTILGFINESPDDRARLALIEVFLTTYGSEPEDAAGTTPLVPAAEAIPDETFGEMAGELDEQLATMREEIESGNVDTGEAARIVRTTLTELQGEQQKQVVLLALLMKSGLLPYAPLPDAVFQAATAADSEPADTASVTAAAQKELCPVVRRIVANGTLSNNQKLVAICALIASQESPDARVMCFSEALVHCEMPLSPRSGLVSLLSSILPGAFLIGPMSGRRPFPV